MIRLHTKTFTIPHLELVMVEDPYRLIVAKAQPWFDELRETFDLEENVYVAQINSDVLSQDLTFRVEVKGVRKRGCCLFCGKEIQIAIFKGEDWCSENCRKALGE